MTREDWKKETVYVSCDYWTDSIENGKARRNCCILEPGHRGYHKFAAEEVTR